MKTDNFPTPMTRRNFIRQAACAALGTAALTNTIKDLRLINTAMAQTGNLTDYKALICIFLSGGNDSNNLIIPTTAAEYAAYASIRSNVLAIPNANGTATAALGLNGADADGRTYGIHPACPEVQSLYNTGKVAAVFNVGTLVYPLTRAQYDNKSVPRPPQLMSHGDQQTQWQTSIPDQVSSSGWGGRCADLLHTLNPQNGVHDNLSLAISLAGNNIFEVGGVAQPYIVNSGGIVSLTAGSVANSGSRASNRLQTMKNIIGNDLLDFIGTDPIQQNMLSQNYAMALDHSLAIGAGLSTALTATQLGTYWNTYPASVVVPNGGPTFNSSLMSQLKMIAKIIEAGYRAAPGGLGMKRQIFFCQAGGYDTHVNQTANSANNTVTPLQAIQGTQANLLAEISQCMNAFQNAMVKIGQQYGDVDFEKRVTTFTASDFGRSLATNGLGSDHGWGGHHLVMGGAVKGGKGYGKYPAMAVNGPDDIGAGRLLPSTSVDQFAATMAKWFGVDNAGMATVFPNLSRFATPDLGFMV